MKDAAPDSGTVEITGLEESVSPLSGGHRSIGTVALHEHLRGTEDVEVGDHPLT
jgi:hypothetical protein